MAVEKIIEPDRDGATFEDWEKLIDRTTAQGGGFMKLVLRNLNTAAEPAIARGSRFEINGSFYLVKSVDEKISGSVSNDRWVFIYAKPPTQQNPSFVFEYSANMPQWDIDRCGWYNGDARAVAKLYKRSDGWWGKVVTGTYENMFEDNFSVIPKITNFTGYTKKGDLSKINTLAEQLIITLKRGVYGVTLKGAIGGSGAAGNGNNSIVSTPKDTTAEQFTHYISEIEAIVYMKQGQGGGSGSGGNITTWSEGGGGGTIRTGGGGGARGGASWIIFPNKILAKQGTSGTNGTAGTGSSSGAAGIGVATNTLINLTNGVNIESHENGGNAPDVGSGSAFTKGGLGGTTNNLNNGQAILYLIYESLTESQFNIV